MSVSLYFGLPGAGKTSLIAFFCHKYTHMLNCPYKHIYTNVPINMPGVNYVSNDMIGTYDLSDCLLLIDEGSLFADNRDYKTFSKDRLSFFMLHRHYRCDVKIFSQGYNAVDKKIRTVCDRVYYVFKPFLFGHWFTEYYRIPYSIIIPSKKDTNSSNLGDIVEGYCKPSFIERLFCKRVYRPKYYKYFDTYECPPLKELPYSPFIIPKKQPVYMRYLKKARVFLLSRVQIKKNLIYFHRKKI